jgi:hypothetical protein
MEAGRRKSHRVNGAKRPIRREESDGTRRRETLEVLPVPGGLERERERVGVKVRTPLSDRKKP